MFMSFCLLFFKQKTAYEVRISDWNSDVCSSDLACRAIQAEHGYGPAVGAAIDRSHQAMGELQKETLEHVFAMRAVLKPEQAAKFDATVVRDRTSVVYGKIV